MPDPLLRVAIVVPCFNEAARLSVDEFVRFADGNHVRFVFCNDGSTDDTAAVLDRLTARAKGAAETLTLPRNRGKAEAVRQGLVRALESGADVVGYFDADLATPLSELPAMLALFEDESVLAVTGARIQLHGRDIVRRRVRHYTGRAFATAATFALGRPYYDTQCGAKLFRSGPTLEAALSEPFSSSWIFDVELLGRLLRGSKHFANSPHGVLEHPLGSWHDVGASKVSALAFARAPFDLLRVAVELRLWESRLAARTERAPARAV